MEGETTIVQYAGVTDLNPSVRAPRIEIEASREELRDLMLGFASLGANCEFGLVQRAAGAEPLGLFRFAAAPIEAVTLAISDRFAGLGLPSQTTAYLIGDAPEYFVLDNRFGFYVHSWMNKEKHNEADVLTRTARQFPFLARTMLEDLEEGSKIFVAKQGTYPQSSEAIASLAAAIRACGPAALLWVDMDSERCGVVEHVEANLFRGYLDYFAPVENAGDFSFAAWVVLCRSAQTMVREWQGRTAPPST